MLFRIGRLPIPKEWSGTFEDSDYHTCQVELRVVCLRGYIQRDLLAISIERLWYGCCMRLPHKVLVGDQKFKHPKVQSV